jgi:hypothetical protein
MRGRLRNRHLRRPDDDRLFGQRATPAIGLSAKHSPAPRRREHECDRAVRAPDDRSSAVAGVRARGSGRLRRGIAQARPRRAGNSAGACSGSRVSYLREESPCPLTLRNAATRERGGRPLVRSGGGANSRSRRASPRPPECLQEGWNHPVLGSATGGFRPHWRPGAPVRPAGCWCAPPSARSRSASLLIALRSWINRTVTPALIRLLCLAPTGRAVHRMDSSCLESLSVACVRPTRGR